MAAAAWTRVAVFAVGMIMLAAGPAGATTIQLNTVATGQMVVSLNDPDSATGTLSPTTNLQIQSRVETSFIDQNVSGQLIAGADLRVRGFDSGVEFGVGAATNLVTTFSGGQPIANSGGLASATALLQVTDSLAIIDGPTTGSLRFIFQPDGFVDASAFGFANPGVNRAGSQVELALSGLSSEVPFVRVSADAAAGLGGGQSTTNGRLNAFDSPFHFDRVFQFNSFTLILRLEANAFSQLSCVPEGPTTTSNCTALASAAYFNTLTLGAIEVYDLNGVLDPDAFVRGASGITYNNTLVTPPAAVPEPATLLLFGAGASYFAARRSRRPRTW